MNVKLTRVGNVEYGLIEEQDKYIVTENDFCHWVHSRGETIELFLGLTWLELDGKTYFAPNYADVSLDMLKAHAMPMTPEQFKAWGHYWGIKDRVCDNYELLLASMRDIGADTSDMPKWEWHRK